MEQGRRQRMKSQLDGSHVRLSQLQKKRSGPAAPAALLPSSKEEDRRLESSQKHSRNPHAGSIKEKKRALNKQNKTKQKRHCTSKVLHACNPSTPEPEAGGLPQV